MSYTLHPDQEEAVNNVRNAFRRNKFVLLQSATGSGKTAMATHMLEAAIAKGKRVLFTVPRRQLLKQTSETFESHGVKHSFVASGEQYNPYSSVFIGMIESMSRRIDKLPDVDLCIFDETHFGEGALTNVINYYKDRGAFGLGLSATPWKLSGKGLGCYYDDMVHGKSMRWLIDNKRLSEYKYFRAETKLDFSGIKTTAGDYNMKQADEFMQEHEKAVIGDCVKEYRNRSFGKRHIIRCVSIARSQAMAFNFNAQGIAAAHVDGKTPDNEMRQIIMAFAKREIKVICFCDLLNFGFDLAQYTGMDATIESGADTKPSKSLAGQMQFWGRMLRMKPEEAHIYDHVNNWQEHGLPCSEREWSLEDREQGKKSAHRAPPTKQCDNCFAIHSPAPKCLECGHVYTVKERQIEELDGELVEVSKEEIKAQKKEKRMEVGKAKTYLELKKIGVERGYSSGWAYVMAKKKGLL